MPELHIVASDERRILRTMQRGESIMSSEPTIEELGGLWRRSLIAWPDGRRDSETFVNWLQGASFYIDLRQPHGRPDFRSAASLDQLTQVQIEWLATQEGFAGELSYADGYFEWHRELDFQVKAAHPDQGRLQLEGDAMVEEGMEGRYIEHWHRQRAGPACALRFEDRLNGCRGFIIRLRDIFMYGRSRSAAVPPTCHLVQQAKNAPSPAAARDLIDCEISQGIVTADAWIIQRSTLPFKEGCPLAPRLVAHRDAMLAISDLSRDGRQIERHVEITNVQGELRSFALANFPASEAMEMS
jgi:hypothetical protein